MSRSVRITKLDDRPGRWQLHPAVTFIVIAGRTVAVGTRLKHYLLGRPQVHDLHSVVALHLVKAHTTAIHPCVPVRRICRARIPWQIIQLLHFIVIRTGAVRYEDLPPWLSNVPTMVSPPTSVGPTSIAPGSHASVHQGEKAPCHVAPIDGKNQSLWPHTWKK